MTAATAAALLAALLPAGRALAHASDRGHVLLLPTGYYVVGGALAVAASFLVLSLLRPEHLVGIWRHALPLGRTGEVGRLFASLLSAGLLVVLVAAGLLGSRDPLSNPLPLTVWTLLWVGLTLIQGLFGNCWAWINPWYGPWRVIRSLSGRSEADAPPLQLPGWLGAWPAVIAFLLFAWFELVYPAPDDPARLGLVVGVYWLATLIGMLVFGYRSWASRCEFLTVFFWMVSRFGMFGRDPEGEAAGEVRLVLPGSRLMSTNPLTLSGTMFLLLALASVSFDGLSRTFFWLGLNGVNPLEYPGRTALTGINGVGLVGAALLLAAAFFAAIAIGERLAGGRQGILAAAGHMVWSIVPIALAYHFSHYLTSLAVNSQYALVAFSDPFSLGWNLFGTAHRTVDAGIVMGADAARAIWNIQAFAIVAGHMVAVLVAHGLAFRLHAAARDVVLSQVPLAALMVGYTVLGLWLLSTPAIG